MSATRDACVEPFRMGCDIVVYVGAMVIQIQIAMHSCVGALS